jgi:hypothetical protein
VEVLCGGLAAVLVDLGKFRVFSLVLTGPGWAHAGSFGPRTLFQLLGVVKDLATGIVSVL